MGRDSKDLSTLVQDDDAKVISTGGRGRGRKAEVVRTA